MPAVTVKRFVKTFRQGGHTHYSIRRRDDGSFQLYHDNPYAGIPQPYEFDYVQLSGRFRGCFNGRGGAPSDAPRSRGRSLRRQTGAAPQLHR
jgi:hypothetical protein